MLDEHDFNTLDFDDEDDDILIEDDVSSDNTFQPRERPNLDAAIEALKSGKVLHTAILYGLSDLSDADIKTLEPVWNSLTPAYRRKITRQLAESGEMDYELDYRAVGLFALGDSDPAVRAAAIEVLWVDETLELMHRLIHMASGDQSVDVRAAAASALGRFILAGELGELPEEETRHAQETVIALFNNHNEDVMVRRRALEAISNCGNPMVESAIHQSYNSSDERMRISAVFAMGRTCDSKWEATILKELHSSSAEMQYEAIRAAGELELEKAVPQLGKLVLSDDREVQETAIWSLGEIGGSEALRILNALAEVADENEDEELQEAIEEALGNANLASFELDDDFS